MGTQYLNHHSQETSSLNEQDLSEYCRKNGLFISEIDNWKVDFIKSANRQSTSNKEDKAQLKQLRTDNKSLKKELRRREKALAEAVALLVLRKKMGCALGGKQGRLIPHSARINCIQWVDEAIKNKARRALIVKLVVA